ncbi:stage II sporulation protein M [Teredinibacter purpureus]|uniref:stage II sporulation protein M n=1 Tax=Teredinibacter purpureus TaxID=2731756 RepID=UPI0005F7EC34|nr:stage II sporulation protein M [Teredinibacter purpureus]
MKQQSFESKNSEMWQQLDVILSSKNPSSDKQFPQLFRALCQQLAVAKHRRYSPQLVDKLNDRVIKAHHIFYQHNRRFHFQWLDFFVWGFPDAVRRNRAFVGVAAALFLIPLLGMALACYFNEEFIYSFMAAEEVRGMESMYDPSNDKIGRDRDTNTDVAMFGYYIYNNIGISFRSFAGGILFGLGSIFFMVFNGLAIGGVAGHLTQVGYSTTFYPFVAGHGSFELTAIVLSGAAGLKLGYAMVNPGQLSFLHSVRAAGRDSVLIVYGSIVMLLIAAFIEAFWSSTTTLPHLLKYSVGIIFWIAVIAYFIYSGRRYGSR